MEIRQRRPGRAEFARIQIHTLQLLKIGAVLVRNTRRMRIPLSGSCPPGVGGCSRLLSPG